MSTPSVTPPRQTYQGNDKLLAGLVTGVITFWLFAQSTGTVAPVIQADLNQGAEVISSTAMNFAVSVTALFSGMFIVLMGGFADRYGRVKIALIGNVLGLVGSLLIVVAAGPSAVPLILLGRAIQGVSAACIMPATLSLVRTYWEGKARQRAVSLWSIGTFGGSGLSSIVAGVLATSVGWRSIFVISALLSVISFLIIRGTPESKIPPEAVRKADPAGIATFLITLLALMTLLIFGRDIGFFSPMGIGLIAVMIGSYTAFYVIEKRSDHPFIDFRLFRNRIFTGATLVNFAVNGSVGVVMVTQQLLQIGGGMSARDAGLLTLGYALAIILFIRLGEKVMQRTGARLPLLLGIASLALGTVLLMPTNLLLSDYKILAAIAYTFFGLGLALFATPATDSAITNLPPEQSGAGAGIFKMASSLGGALGAGISLTLFVSFAGNSASMNIIGNVLEIEGRTDNIGIRQAADVALLFNLMVLLMAFVVALLMIPKKAGTPAAEKEYQGVLKAGGGVQQNNEFEEIMNEPPGPGSDRRNTA